MPRRLRSIHPIPGAFRSVERRLGLKAEIIMILPPTLAVLAVLTLIRDLAGQRLLFAPLAASAFLIYLDPEHHMNSIRTLLVSQLGGALIGWGTYLLLGDGVLSGGTAMVATIVLMIALNSMHPPAIATAISFALRTGKPENVLLFGLAVLITAALVALERVALWLLLRRAEDQQQGPSGTA